MIVNRKAGDATMMNGLIPGMVLAHLGGQTTRTDGFEKRDFCRVMMRKHLKPNLQSVLKLAG